MLFLDRKREIVSALVDFIVFWGSILLSIILGIILGWPKIINVGIWTVIVFIYMLRVNMILFVNRNCYLELDEENLNILLKNGEVIIMPYREINVIELHKSNEAGLFSIIEIKLIAFNKKTYKVTFFGDKEKKSIDVVLTFLKSLNERVAYTLIDKTGLIE